MNVDIIYKRIWKDYCESGTMRSLAKRYGVTAGYINDLLKHRRMPGPKILKHFGLKRRTVFVYEKFKAQ